MYTQNAGIRVYNNHGDPFWDVGDLLECPHKGTVNCLGTKENQLGVEDYSRESRLRSGPNDAP